MSTDTIVTNGTASEILNAPILPADAPTGDDVPSWLRGIADDMNNGPVEPGTLRTHTVNVYDRNGRLKATFDVAYSTGHTTVDVPEHLYSENAGKNVVSSKTNAYDEMLDRLALVRGGTKAYIPLPWKRDEAGFKSVDRKLASEIRKAAERLALRDRAAQHRFDYSRFTVMPASDAAPSNVAGYVRIVFTGTRVK